MPVASFNQRLALVRQRFVSTLESKIEDTYADLPKLSSDGRGVAETLDETYRRIHGIVAVGATVGFPATGKAARMVENVLLGPHQAARALAANELAALKKALHALRQTAEQELQATFTSWR